MPFPKNAHKHSPCIKPSSKPAVLEALRSGPKTANEIAPLAGVARDTVAKVLRDMPGKVYICDWAGPQTAIWSLGNEPHKPRPAPNPKSQKQIDSKQRQVRSDAAYLNRGYVTGERVWGI